MGGGEDLVEGEDYSLRRVVFGVLLGAFLVILVLLVTWSNVQDVEFGAEITDYHSDGDAAFIELAAGANKENITLVSFTFTDADGGEYIYETTEGIQNISVPYFRFLFWKIYRGGYGYSVKAVDVGLENFDDIVLVKVGFSYEVNGKNKTASKTVKTQPLASAEPDPEEPPTSGGVTIPPVTNETGNETCVSTVTCGAGDCGLIDDGCGGTINCGACSLPCEVGVNCFYVSVDGSGSHDGGSVGDAMNLGESQFYSTSNSASEITFLLASGNYGTFSDNNERSDWHTWKANGDVLFDNIVIGSHSNSEIKPIYLGMEGIEVYSNQNTLISTKAVRFLKFDNMDVHGEVSSTYGSGCSRYTTPNGFDGNRQEEITISNSKVYDIKDVGIVFRASNSRAENNEIYWIGNDNLRIWGTNAGGLSDKENFYFIGNEIYESGECLEVGGHPDAFQMYISYAYDLSNIVFDGNKIHDITSQGIFFSPGYNHSYSINWVYNVTIINNVLWNVGASDVAFNQVNKLFIEHNTFGGTNINPACIDVTVKNNLAFSNSYPQNESHITEWDYGIVNGWQDSYGANSCKGPVDFVDFDNADFRPLVSQSAGNCNPCGAASDGGDIGALGCV
jgi:hypothetical protein